MPRVLTLILVLTALIIQIGMGALPGEDATLCIPLGAKPSCCCCDGDDDSGATSDPCCPCKQDCERCIRLPSHDGRATLTARPQASFGRDLLIAAMTFGVSAPLPTCTRPVIFAAPRATESPPHLARLRTTRLII